MKGRPMLSVLLICGGGGACSTGKTGSEFGGGGATAGAADSSADGGTTTGGTPTSDPRNEWLSCGAITESALDVFSETTAETTLHSCSCTLTLSPSDLDTNLDVSEFDVVGGINDTATVGSPDGRPIKVAVEVPWSDTRYEVDSTLRIESSTAPDSDLIWWGPNGDWSPDDAGMNGTTKPSALIAGDYVVYMSRIMSAVGSGGVIGTCSDLFNVHLRVIDAASGAPAPVAPPSRPINPQGVPEVDLVCTPGHTATTTVQLVDFVGYLYPQPLPVDGSAQIAESKLDSVTVTQWNQADQLIVRATDGNQLTLTPASPTASLTGLSAYYGAVSFLPSRQADTTTTWTNPQLSLTHSCPATRSNSDVDVDQGYALTLGDLQTAVNSATGGVGLSDLVTATSQPDWPVMVLRVFPSTTDPSATAAFSLVLELQGTGTRINTSLPLALTAFNRWSLDAAGTDWAISGTVARDPGTLTLTLTSGSISALQLQPVTLVLPALP